MGILPTGSVEGARWELLVRVCAGLEAAAAYTDAPRSMGSPARAGKAVALVHQHGRALKCIPGADGPLTPARDELQAALRVTDARS